MDQAEISIGTLVESFKNYKIFKKDTEVLTELLEYSKLHSTSETAEHYSNVLQDLLTKIQNSKLKKSDKELTTSLLTSIVALAGSAHCQNIVIQEQNEIIAKYDVVLENINKEYQNERDEHNQLRKKYNENLKSEKIQPMEAFMPAVDLSITLNDKNKFIPSKDIVEIMKANKERFKNNTGDKFRRISNKNENGEKINKNIKAVFGKPNKDNLQNVKQV